jgi:hypothetical protein
MTEIPNNLRKKPRKQVPFGYKASEEFPGYIEPIERELKVINKAREYYNRTTHTDLIQWIYARTGRRLSIPGLHKVMRRGY